MSGDVRRLKLLVGPYPATLRYDKFLYGMQKVRGSNPLSSTIFHVLVRVKSDHQLTTAPGSACMLEAGPGPAMRTKASSQVSK
jgi:hypothetical protein